MASFSVQPGAQSSFGCDGTRRGGLMFAAHAFHQLGVDFTDKTQPQRQRCQPIQSMFQRPHVIVHLANVGGVLKKWELLRLEGIEVGKRRLCPFNTGREHSFPPHEGDDE